MSNLCEGVFVCVYVWMYVYVQAYMCMYFCGLSLSFFGRCFISHGEITICIEWELCCTQLILFSKNIELKLHHGSKLEQWHSEFVVRNNPRKSLYAEVLHWDRSDWNKHPLNLIFLSISQFSSLNWGFILW